MKEPHYSKMRRSVRSAQYTALFSLKLYEAQRLPLSARIDQSRYSREGEAFTEYIAQTLHYNFVKCSDLSTYTVVLALKLHEAQRLSSARIK